MNPITKLFRRKPATDKGVMLEIQSGFSAFSGTVYGNAAYRAAVDAIARHAVKLKAHADSAAVERLLSESPNAYMSGFDLLYKTSTAYFTANNAFILIDRDGSGGISAFYPLTPASVEFIGASGGGVFVKMTFPDGKTVTLPYADIIHLRRHFANNELLLKSAIRGVLVKLGPMALTRILRMMYSSERHLAFTYALRHCLEN